MISKWCNMNRFYLLIPAIDEEDAGQEIAYLNLIGDVNVDDVVSIIRKMIKGMEYVEEEDVELVYDKTRLNQLFRHAKEKQEREGNGGEMPQIENLFVFFNDAVGIQGLKSAFMPSKVNGMLVENGIINAYLENGSKYDILLNKDALNRPGHPIEVEDVKGEKRQLWPLSCDAADVYLWLVENRYPKRVLDTNYAKHSENEKRGKKGAKISALTYSEHQLHNFLKRAVAARHGSKELYFKDNDNDKIVIFFDENLDIPTYHVFEISTDDTQEIQKIFQRGGSKLMKRIEATSVLGNVANYKGII